MCLLVLAVLAKANKRIRQLEAEVEILCKAAGLPGEILSVPKAFTQKSMSLFDAAPGEGIPRPLLGVSAPGYYKYRNRPMSPTKMRRRSTAAR